MGARGQGSSLHEADGLAEVKANAWFRVRCTRSLEWAGRGKEDCLR